MITHKFKKYSRVLSRRHKKFKAVLKRVGALEFTLPYWRSIEDAVVYSVIGQMLSNSASASIISSLKDSIGPSRQIILWASKNYMRPGPIHGVSQRKRRALFEWYRYATSNGPVWTSWGRLSLDEYRKEICSIWGFGRWSADMIGIFYLGRMDVWPENDTGLKNACKVIFGSDNAVFLKKYIRDCETVAALYLWELINRKILREFLADGQSNKRAKTQKYATNTFGRNYA